jgi:hypothetical protein
MNIYDSKITSLREKVNAAHQEFDLAIQFHEAWKLAAYDMDLQKRMGKSYATHTFNVVLNALRREMLLALMRLWDRDSKTVGMESIAENFRCDCIINTLAAKFENQDLEAEAKEKWRKEANEVIDLVDKYSNGGTQYDLLNKLRNLRNKKFAHREVKQTKVAVAKASLTDKEIESVYQDTLKLITLLLSIIGTFCELEEFAGVYRHYATFFWAGVRGEQTEGHPNYRSPINSTSDL